ncbi:hypothetical protein A2Y83_01175 [Candidatus Falkowbacteria bacterium RBG_13_39_14]|uniref:Uncharacterized protein n=1 Tax=Candidatus Falkowbacteria bacterium RBG_13_39_14 TaxID=1797985 RepID=A0A1F5S119_9BACT|nr:MAG: hypothetical protein A2Y83_01175 [Candidatus Falkowbacteria bacterium RBG_13_39_14]
MIKDNKKIRLAVLGSAVIACVLVLSATYSFAVSSLRELNDGEFILNIKEGQKVDLAAKKVRIEKLLDAISKQAKVEIKVKDEAGGELATVILKNEPLAGAIKRIVGNNYILSFKKNEEGGFEVTKGDVLSIKDRVKEFIGSIMIDGPVAKMFFMSEDTSPESIAEYIKERHKLLDDLADQYPDKEIEAQISLKDFLTGDEVLAIAGKYNVKVKILNDGWEEGSGEIEVRKDEPLSETVKRLNEDYKGMLDGFIAMASGTSGQEQEEVKWKKYLKNFEEKGVMIYGIKLEGKTTEIKKMKDEAKQVRLADPLWKGSLYDLLSKTHIVSPIAIPLQPYSEPVSDLEK